jgi:proteasome lid subunit RPN8/RPN11
LKQPRILGAEEIRIEERQPPPSERTKPHKWLSAKDLEEFKRQEKEGYELYISKVAEEKMRNHSLHFAEMQKEVMGLLLGWIYKNGGKEYSIVKDVVTTDLESSSVHVRFDRNAFEKLFVSLEEVGFNYLVVGWYHSHPGYGCFMSSTDVYTQRSLFKSSWHTAIVIDPVNKEIKAFYLDGRAIKTRNFAIYWDEYENPYYGTRVKKRELRSDPDRVASSQ